MKQHYIYLAFFLSLAFPCAGVTELTVAGVSIPEQSEAGGNALVLNGTGIRKATFFRVKVYVAALYSPSKSGSEKALIHDIRPVRLNLRFVRPVDRESLVEAFREGFEKAPSYSQSVTGAVKQFLEFVPSVKDGERFDLIFHRDRVKVITAGKGTKEFEGEQFGKSLLEIWLGPDPPNTDLKEGLLGR